MMGMQTMQAQQPMQSGGKGSMIQPQQSGYSQQPRPMDMGMGMGQGMGQQARFGQPNRYSNTTQQPWDNANINPQPMQGGGKGGKGGGMQQGGQMQGGAGKGQAGGGYPTAATNFGQPTQTTAYPTAATNFGIPRDPSISVTNTASTPSTANTGLQNDQTYNELDYRNMGS